MCSYLYTYKKKKIIKFIKNNCTSDQRSEVSEKAICVLKIKKTHSFALMDKT